MFKNKNILITGCCGTVGRELLKQLADIFNPLEIIGIDNNESELFFLEQEYGDKNNKFFQINFLKSIQELIGQI